MIFIFPENHISANGGIPSSHSELIWSVANTPSPLTTPAGSAPEPSQFISYEPISAYELYAAASGSGGHHEEVEEEYEEDLTGPEMDP